MLFNAGGELVLIRNTYGASDMFVLPGGGIKPFEQPAAAAKREIEEELGAVPLAIEFTSRHFSAAEGKRDEIYLFEAIITGPLKIDSSELAEATFAALDDLPRTTSPATRRRIEEHLGVRQADGNW